MRKRHEQAPTGPVGRAGVVRFTGRIEIRGINPYVPVGSEIAARVMAGWRKPMPVKVRVNGQPNPPWRINMMPAGDGSFYLYLSGIVRDVSGTGVGDEVEVELAFDGEYRSGPAHPMPSLLAKALERNALARRGWAELPPSRQKEILRYLTGLKSEEALERNIERALHVLAGGQARFMARSWNREEDR